LHSALFVTNTHRGRRFGCQTGGTKFIVFRAPRGYHIVGLNLTKKVERNAMIDKVMVAKMPVSEKEKKNNVKIELIGFNEKGEKY